MRDTTHGRDENTFEGIKSDLEAAYGDAGAERRAAAQQSHVTHEDSPEGELKRARLEATNADVPGDVATAAAVHDEAVDVEAAKDYYTGGTAGVNETATAGAATNEGDTPVYDRLAALQGEAGTPTEAYEVREDAHGHDPVNYEVDPTAETVNEDLDEATATGETTDERAEREASWPSA